MSGNTGDDGRSVTSRVLGILDAFDIEHPRLTLSDIARRASLSLTTAHRLVGELTEWRALERGEDGRYSIGLRLWEAGLLGPLHTRLREIAMPFLQGLYEATRENVHLAVRDGNEALYVEKLSGHRSVPIVSRTGGRLPLHTTGVGKALLAWETCDHVDQYLAHPLARLTRYSISEPGRLRKDLQRIRSRGYATTQEEMTLGNCSVACPILDAEGRPIAAVGVVVHTVRVEPDRLAPPILAAAKGIADRLAAAGDDPYPGYVHDLDLTKRMRRRS
ncbi:IclR family transcriptional regulator [Lentzea tibetensis]|uniref:IclR family transcriptional regulator n=1 Tax=Lentzea tibetensis TaxID=2591470 RepID=A0A563F161_9PSEU|nr:IclR family transcriptional regulator [Lentzea tibetensis]TWP53726.1 IclR family transcriptional regulator [Lentzea tibetensis]